jgi:hypothetical protein
MNPTPVQHCDYLPLFPPAIRQQALRLLLGLLDHARSIENNQGERPREVSLSRR